MKIGAKGSKLIFRFFSIDLSISIEIILEYLDTDLSQKILLEFSQFYHYSIDNYSRCRWSTNSDEPFLFVMHTWKQLNILDIEKKALTLKESLKLEKGSNCT
jgi:hypothetical protein